MFAQQDAELILFALEKIILCVNHINNVMLDLTTRYYESRKGNNNNFYPNVVFRFSQKYARDERNEYY